MGDFEDGSSIVGVDEFTPSSCGCPCLLKCHVIGIVCVLSKFTDPPDPQRDSDQVWVSCSVFLRIWWDELEL